MAELVKVFRQHKRWERGVFLVVVALQLMQLYGVVVSLWLFAHHQFPLMTIRGIALILGVLCLRLALWLYLGRWHRAAFWMMAALAALAELTGVVDGPDMLSATLFAFLVFPLFKSPLKAHA